MTRSIGQPRESRIGIPFAEVGHQRFQLGSDQPGAGTLHGAGIHGCGYPLSQPQRLRVAGP